MDYYQKNIYYVYKHTDPHTLEIMYIGHGTGGRAWLYGTYLGGIHKGTYGHRHEDHTKWCENLAEQGFVPPDWTSLLDRCLTKSEACVREQEKIRKLNPKFNQPLGKHLLKLNSEEISAATDLRKDGMSYENIAVELNSSAMTIWRAVNGKNKNTPDV